MKDKFEVVTCGRHNTTENQKFFVKLGSSMQGAEGDTFEEALNKAHAAARADVEKRVAALNAAFAGKLVMWPSSPKPCKDEMAVVSTYAGCSADQRMEIVATEEKLYYVKCFCPRTPDAGAP